MLPALRRASGRLSGRRGGLMVALVLLVLLVSSSARPSPAFASGVDTFTVEGSIFEGVAGSGSGAACVGQPASLAPGVQRCVTYRIKNQTNEQIIVRSIKMGVDPGFPGLPAGCPDDDLALPTFSGALVVPAYGSQLSPGLPIMLRDTATNQDACKDVVLHFVFSGSGVSGDPTAPGTKPSEGGLAFTGANVSR